MLTSCTRDLSVLSKLSDRSVFSFKFVFMYSVISLGDLFPKCHGSCNLPQEDRASETGQAAEVRESTLSVHACFLIKNLSQRDEHVRDISVSLLTQLRERFPQVNLHLCNLSFDLVASHSKCSCEWFT